MKTAEEIFKKSLIDLGFDNHKPSEMSNSDYWLCTMHAMKLYANQKLDESACQVEEFSFKTTEQGVLVESILSLKDQV